jgi:hypothetical protein
MPLAGGVITGMFFLRPSLPVHFWVKPSLGRFSTNPVGSRLPWTLFRRLLRQWAVLNLMEAGDGKWGHLLHWSGS